MIGLEYFEDPKSLRLAKQRSDYGLKSLEISCNE